MAPGRSLLLFAGLAAVFVAGWARAQARLPESLAGVSPAQRAKVDPTLVAAVRAHARAAQAGLPAAPERVLVQLGSAALAALAPGDRAGRRAEVARLQGRVLPDLPAADASVLWTYASLPALALSVRSERALARLAARGEVVRVYPSLDEQYDLLASVAQVRANARQAAGNLGAGVVVAVLDSGVDTDHPDLASSLVGQECFLSGGGCPGGGTRRSGPGAAEDDVGHGTHVAGIVTSDGLVSDGPGVAPGAGILAMKVGTPSGITTADWVAAIDFILSNPALGVRVVNMSFGTTTFASGGDCDSVDPVAANAVHALRTAGIVTFAASGNQALSDGIGLPACFHDSVSVGSASAADAVSAATNTAPNLDVLAPGENIDSDWLNGGHAALSGTSMASPHAAGCAALLIEAGDATTPDEIEALLESSPVRPVDPDNGLAFPRLSCRPGGQDLDVDGVPDEFEASGGCPNPLDRDSDDDGLKDGVEDVNQNGVVDPGETSPCSADSDDDGLQDGTERGVTQGVPDPDGAGPQLGTNPLAFAPDLAPATRTNPLDPDSDGDGMKDGQEDANHNGRVDPGEFDPLDPGSVGAPIPVFPFIRE